MIAGMVPPAAWELKAAYNPIPVEVGTTGVCPVVYLDIYVSNKFYKTMASTTPTTGDTTVLGTWKFDIRDALQEVLRAIPPTLIGEESEMINDGLTYCFVKARGSSLAGGYLVPEGPIPVQGTKDTAPVSGGGLASPQFIVLNAALQQEQRIPLETWLSQYNMVQPGRLDPIYNLFINPRIEVTHLDYLHLPVLFDHDAIGGSTSGTYGVTIIATDRHGNQYPYFLGSAMTYFSDSVYYLPAGPRNFEGLTPGAPVIPGVPPLPIWTDIVEYYIVLEFGAFQTGNFRWQSPTIYVKWPTPDRKRFRFVNWLGHFDVINFEQFNEEFVTSSAAWHKYNPGDFHNNTIPKPDGSAGSTTGKEQFGHMRYNVRSNELTTATGCFTESQMWYVKQFLSTPVCYVETKGIEGQIDFMLPVVIQDATVVTRKIDERWVYEVTIKYEPANERINIRN